MKTNRKFFNRLIDANDNLSSKRFVTLLIAGFFILASFVVLFFSFYVIIVSPRGDVKPNILDLLGQILEYSFYIILGGLGFITGDNLASILLEKAKVLAKKPEPTVTADRVENVHIESHHQDSDEDDEEVTKVVKND